MLYLLIRLAFLGYRLNDIDQKTATKVGFCAVRLWGSVIAFIHAASEKLGPTAGSAIAYTLASLILFVTVGFPTLDRFPKPYLFAATLLFVAYEVCLTASIGLAASGQQTIQVSMVNYLWPTITVTFSMFFDRKKFSLLIIGGIAMSMLGVLITVGGTQGLRLAGLLENIGSNPVSYGLAFVGAVLWSLYSILTSKAACGQNGITFFFTLTSVALWGVHFVEDGSTMHLDFLAAVYVLGAAFSLGFGYAAWNIGILRGDVKVLASASYFTPIVSAILAAIILRAPLSPSFFLGVCLVVAGSLMSLAAARSSVSM